MSLRHSAALILAILSSHLNAQGTAETIRGRVTSDSGKPLVATVVVTRGPDRLVKNATTDSGGNYRVLFEEGTGDYLVYVASTGYRSARRRVQRQGTEHELVANFTLAVDLTVLEATKVTADKPVRATNVIGPMQLETGSSEKWLDGVSSNIPPNVAGDLTAIANTLPNITMTSGGPSILGSGPSSNLNTLNGLGFSGAAVPRAARTETRVTGATFDATRGGFAGSNTDVRLGPGSRQYQNRRGYLTLDPPAWQFTDPTAKTLGATSGGFRGSLGFDGELIRRALTYNVAVDVARSSSDPATLLDADPAAFLRSGVAPDSVSRIMALASPLGLPLSGANVPTDRRHDGLTWLGRFDDTRDTLATRALTTYVGFTKDGALGFNATAAPSAAGERSDRTLGLQLTLGNYVGPGRRMLTESRFGLSATRTHVTPYTNVPGASILVRTPTVDGTPDVAGITLGGGSSLASDDSRWTAEAGNQTIWNAGGRRHRFQASLWGRADGLKQDGNANVLGTFSYNSLADFAANRPTSYTRTLTQPERSGSVWNSAAAFSHQWAPTRFFSVLYGARVEADGFTSAPERNTALEQALGVETGLAPSRVHVSPRVGFNFQYNRDRDNGNGMSMNQIGRFNRNSYGVIRGGIGEFRDILRPQILADASAATGLPGGTSILSCVGSAVPSPVWSRFVADPSTVPTQCNDGSGVLADRSPSVTLIDKGFDTPRSWRASLEWITSWHNWTTRVSALGSYDLSQPGTVDANFAGAPKFTLESEGNRPVFVSAASIDPASGAVSPTESRRSSLFGRVGERVSDLRGYGEQLTFVVAPDPFKVRLPAQLYASAGYTIQSSRRQFRGFDGASFGDPRTVEWAPNPLDARHVIILSGGFSTRVTGSFTLFSRLQSGLPFTPVVQGDVNGDGRAGDRAFVPNPATEANPLLAAQLKSLLTSGSGIARDCLMQNLGRVVPRNGCRGPWTQSLDVSWRPPIPGRFVARVTPNVFLQNVLAGVDELVHGSTNLRGWGSPAMPDPTLLVPRGYDATQQRFLYDVNARFADTRPANTVLRNPFRIVVDVSLNLSTDYDLQQLRRAVEPVKGPEGWIRRSADSLATFYLSNTSDIHKVLLSESDSLFLSASQMTALRRADSVYSARVRAVYVPLGQFLSKGNGGAGKAELDSVQVTQKAYWKIFWEQPEIADSIITPVQRELIPLMKNLLSVPKENREHSQFYFGRPVTLVDTPPRRPQP
jgi:hypothetical protein